MSCQVTMIPPTRLVKTVINLIWNFLTDGVYYWGTQPTLEITFTHHPLKYGRPHIINFICTPTACIILNSLINTRFQKKSFFGCTAYLLIRLYGIYMKEMTTILNDQNSLKNIAQPFFLEIGIKVKIFLRLSYL